MECDSCHLSTQRLSNRDYLLMRLASSDLAFINIYICIHIYILYLPTSLQRCFFTLVTYLSFPNLSTYAVCSLSIAQLSWFVLLILYILRSNLLSTTTPSILASSSLHDILLYHSPITQRSDACLILLVGRGTTRCRPIELYKGS